MIPAINSVDTAREKMMCALLIMFHQCEKSSKVEKTRKTGLYITEEFGGTVR